jgi:hypothetical protein
MKLNIKKCGTENSLAARVTPKGRLNTERGNRHSPRERECDRESWGRPLGEFNRSGTSLSSSVMGPRLSYSEEGLIHFTIGTLDTPPPPERACDSSLCRGTPEFQTTYPARGGLFLLPFPLEGTLFLWSHM